MVLELQEVLEVQISLQAVLKLRVLATYRDSSTHSTQLRVFTVLRCLPLQNTAASDFQHLTRHQWVEYSRGERPPYWTAVVHFTYDQKKALSVLCTTAYVLFKFFVVSTMKNWMKVGQTASEPWVFDDTCYIFYLGNPQSFWNLIWKRSSSSQKVKYGTY